MTINDNINYVYIYFDPTKTGNFEYQDLKYQYEPFYVGIGKRNRYKDHLVEAQRKKSIRTGNFHKFYRIKSILSYGVDPIIIKIHENLTVDESKRIEIELISKIGRRDLNMGPLTNLTDGGDFRPDTSGEKNSMYGLKGELHPAHYYKRTPEHLELQRLSHIGDKNAMFGKKWTDEQKKLHSEKVKNWYATLSEAERAEHTNKIIKRNSSEEHKRKLREAFAKNGHPTLGRKCTTEEKIHISNKLKELGRFKGSKNPKAKKWKIVDNNDNVYFVDGNLVEFCKSRGIKHPTLLTNAGKVGRRVLRGPSKGWYATEIKNTLDISR
jgi:hypothetical protein